MKQRHKLGFTTNKKETACNISLTRTGNYDFKYKIAQNIGDATADYDGVNLKTLNNIFERRIIQFNEAKEYFQAFGNSVCCIQNGIFYWSICLLANIPDDGKTEIVLGQFDNMPDELYGFKVFANTTSDVSPIRDPIVPFTIGKYIKLDTSFCIKDAESTLYINIVIPVEKIPLAKPYSF